MKSRLMAAAAIGAAALAAIAGCGSSSGSSSASSNGKVTLTFFGADYGTGPSNSTTKYWDAIATAFHQAHPNITVNVQTVNWTDFPTKSATLIQNKQYPDIMEGNPAPPYAQSGLIYPVSDVMSQSVAGNLIPKFLKDGQYQGVNYGIPFTTSTRAMYYNKKIFAAAGISAPPKTWADLQADAAKIKAKGNIGYGMPLGSEEAQAEIGMVLGSPAVIPIIQQAGVLKAADYGTADVPGKAGPLSDTLGVHDDIVAFKAGGTSHQAAIKQFLDFVYQDKWQLQFDNEYDLLPATQSAATTMAKDATFSAFRGNITNSINYPSLANWTSVENMIKTQVGQAITGNPAQVLGAIQQTASSGS